MAVVLIVIVSVLILFVVCYKMLPLQGESTHGYEKECGEQICKP